jgi:hypothetical protein
MKNIYKPSLKYMDLGIVLLLTCAMAHSAFADPDTTTRPTRGVSHYDHPSDKLPGTVTVWVGGHYEYQNEKYVWVPAHDAKAPKSSEPYCTPHWVPPGYVRGESGYQPGHWSTETPPYH